MKKKGFAVFSYLGVYLAGLVLALLCEFYDLHVIFGITYTLTSIFLLAIIRLYGLKWGAPAALITYIIAVIFLHRPYFEWITLTEVLFIGILLRKKQIMAALLDSNIREISSLVHNFKQMSDKLTESEERLHHLAYYDSLTGLPNRLHFFNYLKELVAAYSDQSQPIAVMFADLNRFKQVNDTLGHAVGDQLLEKVAERFAGSISDTYQVFRLGGDEFVFVFQYENISDVRTHAKHLCESFSEPILLMDLPVYTTISIGISLYPFDGMDFNHIIKNADMAMYAAKEQGESCYVFYNEKINSLLTEKMHLENGLRSAVQMAQFTLYYQPKVCTTTGKIVGVEALLRWNHPEYGDVAPDKFIPLAEESGIILDIDKWVLGEACRQMKEWQNRGIPSFTISVNISAKHFYQGHLLDVIRGILGESGLEAHYLKLEITEGVFIRKVETVIETITSLREMGVQISIDDFGTGYSSLTQLQRLPISEVKLDRSFIQGIKEDSRKSSVVKAVIELAHIMSLSVVAEGIETKEECAYLSELQCDELQGYLFSRPLPYDEFEKLIVNWKGSFN
jgi:diguanylate cyclase (GGDEF)-like protein